MLQRRLVKGPVLAVLVALGTWAAVAVAQGPADAPDEEGAVLLDAAGFGGAGPGGGMGPGMGMGPGPRRGHGMGRGFGHGHGGGFGRGAGPGAGLLAHAKELGLTTQQKERIEAIHDAQRRRGIETGKDLELAELDMRKLMRDDTPDRRAIESQVDRIATLRAQLHKARVNAMLDAHDVLTPPQRQKLEDLRAKGPGDDDARPRAGRRPGAGPRAR